MRTHLIPEWLTPLTPLASLLLCRPHRLHYICNFRGKGLNFEVDAGNLRAAIPLLAARALAQLGQADVPVLAEFQPRSNQDRVDVDAGLPLELEQHVDPPAVVCASAQYPSPAAKNRAGQQLNQPRRLLDGDCLHLQRPGDAQSLPWIRFRHLQLHVLFIGDGRLWMKAVAESNGLTAFDTTLTCREWAKAGGVIESA